MFQPSARRRLRRKVWGLRRSQGHVQVAVQNGHRVQMSRAAKSVKLSKGTVAHAIASAAMTRIMPEMRVSKVFTDVAGAKSGGRCPGCKIVPGAKAAPSAKKCIVPAIGVLVALSLEGTEEYSTHNQAPEVQLKADPHDSSVEPHARSATTSGPRPAPKVSLPIAPSVGAAGASTCCF
jgi:hypothetical protein